jgi:hypothetical protein
MAHKIVLEKISSETPEHIRESRNVGGTTHKGTMFFGPSVGKSFCFYRDDGAYFNTSEVKEIQYEGKVLTLKTRNSVYKLTIGEEVEPK